MRTDERLKIAMQRNGRLTADSMSLLDACGLDLGEPGRSLRVPCANFRLDILALRDDDIPRYVQDGVADLGIVGANIVAEQGADVETLASLGFGRCRLVISVPERSAIGSLAALDGKRIATSYPSTLARFLRERRLDCRVVELNGSVEIAPLLDVADAVCDIVSTGHTARVNGLRQLHTVLESEGTLIANRGALADPGIGPLIERLMIRIRGSLKARGRRYMMLNAPADALPKLRGIIPSLKSPTVVPLAEEGMVAIHSVIAGDLFWDVMERLKCAGASDIVVVPIETIIQ
jgi:ATP phosphoribosyltransferase